LNLNFEATTNFGWSIFWVVREWRFLGLMRMREGKMGRVESKGEFLQMKREEILG
jgi:hypothetical protein